jgi:phosphoribosylamine-glycine ligase
MNHYRFLVIDYEAGMETARRLHEDGHEVFYYSQREKAYPEWLPTAFGEGFGFPRVKHWTDVIDRVDYVVFPEVGHGALIDWLREKGYRVFGAGKKGELLENDRMHAKRVMKELGISFPKSYQATGISETIQYLSEHPGKHFLKVNAFRGDLETVAVESADEAEAFLYNLYADHGPFSKNVPIVIEDEVDGVYIGQDMFFNGREFLRPFIFGFEDFGSDAIEKASDHSPLDKIFEKLTPYFREIGYRGAFSLEALLTEDGEAYAIDPTSRFPFTLSMIYMNHLRNLGEVIAGVVDGKYVDPEFDSIYAVNLNMAIMEKTSKPRWLTIEYPEDVKVRFLNAIKMNGKVYVHNSSEHTPAVITTAMKPSIQEACDEAVTQMSKVKTIHGVYNDALESAFMVDYVEPYQRVTGERF